MPAGYIKIGPPKSVVEAAIKILIDVDLENQSGKLKLFQDLTKGMLSEKESLEVNMGIEYLYLCQSPMPSIVAKTTRF